MNLNKGVSYVKSGLIALIIYALVVGGLYIIQSKSFSAQSYALVASGAFLAGVLIAVIINALEKRPKLEEVTESRSLVKRY